MSELSFRFAVPDDTPLILRFIRLLAEYEKMADLVTATEEELRGQLFEEKKAEVIFAVLDGKEIGFALFFHNFSTFLGRAGLYLEDLYILEEYRGKGYGKALFRELSGPFTALTETLSAPWARARRERRHYPRRAPRRCRRGA